MPTYFLDLPDDADPISWDPHAGPRPERADTRYFGRAFLEMEKNLADAELEIFLTWSVDRLPSYGDRVVAVVLGDEIGRIPRYIDRVRAVFKCYGIRPSLGAGPVRNPGLTGAAELAHYVVRWLEWMPTGASYGRSLFSGWLRGRRSTALLTVPLGTFNQIDLPIAPLENRPNDLFFAGSIEHGDTFSQRFLSPKVRVRREMLTAINAMARSRPQLRFDIGLTRGFEASAGSPASDYSQRMMAAKVCLAPRGTSVETFRLLEGLRYGCIVVCDPLPRHWFYEGGPFIQLDRWCDLESAIAPLLDDAAALHRAQTLALAWWRDRCSEAAVGQFLARRLNETSGLAIATG